MSLGRMVTHARISACLSSSIFWPSSGSFLPFRHHPQIHEVFQGANHEMKQHQHQHQREANSFPAVGRCFAMKYGILHHSTTCVPCRHGKSVFSASFVFVRVSVSECACPQWQIQLRRTPLRQSHSFRSSCGQQYFLYILKRTFSG